MRQSRLTKTGDAHFHSNRSDGFLGINELIDKIRYLIQYQNLHPTILLKSDHCTTNQSHEFYTKINELGNELGLAIKAPPAVEMSLRYGNIFFHLITVIQPNGRDIWSRVNDLENGLLKEQRDVYNKKNNTSIEKVINHFKSHSIISKNDTYQLNQYKVMEIAQCDLISFSHIVNTMLYINQLMIDDKVIIKPEDGYGTREEIEKYFNQGGEFYVPNEEFIGDLPDVQDCHQEIKRLTSSRIFPHPPKYENWKELTIILKDYGILENIEAGNPQHISEMEVILEHAEKTNLNPTYGSDFHGGEHHKDQELCYQAPNQPFPLFSLS